MYMVSFSIRSSCGMSMAASMLGSPIFSSYVYPMGKGKNFLLAEAVSRNKNKINKSLLSDFKDVAISRRGKFVDFKGIKESHGVMGAIFSTMSIPLFPIIAQDGMETFHFVSFNQESIDGALDKISLKNKIVEHNYRKISAGESVTSGVLLSRELLRSMGLTKAELESLKLAHLGGYFEWPKRKNLTEISEELNLSKVTVLYHIRNAQRKILDLLTNEFW